MHDDQRFLNDTISRPTDRAALSPNHVDWGMSKIWKGKWTARSRTIREAPQRGKTLNKYNTTTIKGWCKSVDEVGKIALEPPFEKEMCMATCRYSKVDTWVKQWISDCHLLVTPAGESIPCGFCEGWPAPTTSSIDCMLIMMSQVKPVAHGALEMYSMK